MVKLIRLVQDLEAWKHHFTEMAKGNRHGQYVVEGLGSQSEKNPIDIKMMSPTEAAVERAIKALVHLEKKEKKTRTQFFQLRVFCGVAAFATRLLSFV